MGRYIVEMDIDSVKIFVEAESEDDALDKAYISFKEAMRNRSLEDMFKGYPINAKEEILSHQYSFD